jgi:hypothetical protein
LLVLAIYSIWLCAAISSGRDLRSFIRMGLSHLERSHASSVIKVDPHYHYYPPNVGGYDGQSYYYIALDPANARYYFQQPAYRYTRILYPMTSRVLAMDNPGMVPLTLILINLLAIPAGTLAVAAWLKRRRLSPWFALIYGLFPGLFVSLQRDLVEPMAFALVAWAVYLLESRFRHRVMWAALVFALAALTRETTIVFPLMYAVSHLLLDSSDSKPPHSHEGRSWRDAATLAVTAVAPLALYKVFLFLWLRDPTGGVSGGQLPSLIPFGGFTSWSANVSRTNELIGIILPAIVCGLVVLWNMRFKGPSVEAALLLANATLFVVMLNHFSYVGYGGSGRVTTGVVLSALYCLPLFDSRRFTSLGWFWLSCLGWIFLWPSLAVFSDNPLGAPNLVFGLVLVAALAWLTRSPGAVPSRAVPVTSPGVRVPAVFGRRMKRAAS